MNTILKNKKIFISGGAGVIGRELVSKLHTAGCIVYVGDLKPRPNEFPPEIIYRQGDLNYITYEELSLFGPEVFIHLAATFERSIETYSFWEDNFSHNVHLSNYLMTLLKDIPTLRRVIFASSYLIYNPDLYTFNLPQEIPYCLKETDPIYPRNLTGMAKFAHEIELRFLDSFCKEKLSIVSVRIYRGYGKGSRCIISRWISDLLDEKTIKVYCKEGMFDYIYAEETAEGLCRLIAHEEVVGIVNLGNGRARKVVEVVEILKKHFPNMSYQEVESDILYEASQAEMTVYKEKIKWIPQLQLEDAIPKIIAYQKEQRAKSEIVKETATNVLITSSSKKIPLIEAVKKASQKFKQGKVYAGDIDNNCLSRFFADEFWLMPGLNQLTAKHLIAFCQEHNISAIIPTRDGELTFFAEISQILKSHNISVMVSIPKTVEQCLDKLKFYEICQENSIPAIPTYDHLQDNRTNYWVVKERFGAGSQKIGLNLTTHQALQHASQLENPIYQPFIEGIEVSIDLYISVNKLLKGIIMRCRDYVVNGESQITTTFYNAKLANTCKKLVDAFDFYGHIVVQAFIDNDNNIWIIECNPRFGGASTLSIAAGLDSFYWFLLESGANSIEQYPFLYNPSKIIKQVRFPQDKIIVQ